LNKDSDFWSRRRAAVAAETEAETLAREAQEQATADAALAQRTDEDFLAELDLPAPEEMDSTDQVQTLLKSAVPQRLKARALRRLWRLNPVLANVDGLVDYGEDYTDAALVVENLQTIYKVGKGMFDKAEQAEADAQARIEAAQRAEARAEAEAAETAADLERETAAAEADPSPDLTLLEPGDTDTTPPEMRAAGAQDPASVTDHDDPDFQAAPVATRRMRFRFEGAT
jgi:hypothetical protein